MKKVIFIILLFLPFFAIQSIFWDNEIYSDFDDYFNNNNILSISHKSRFTNKITSYSQKNNLKLDQYFDKIPWLVWEIAFDSSRLSRLDIKIDSIILDYLDKESLSYQEERLVMLAMYINLYIDMQLYFETLVLNDMQIYQNTDIGVLMYRYEDWDIEATDNKVIFLGNNSRLDIEKLDAFYSNLNDIAKQDMDNIISEWGTEYLGWEGIGFSTHTGFIYSYSHGLWDYSYIYFNDLDSKITYRMMVTWDLQLYLQAIDTLFFLKH